jgi:hypothetical protein
MNYPFIEKIHSLNPSRFFSISPQWVSSTQAKIKSFGRLQEGWDFGVGRPAPAHVVKAALMLCDLGEQMGFEMDAFPGGGGDISVDFCLHDELVEVTINTDLTLALTHEAGIGFDYDEIAHFDNVKPGQLVKYLTSFQARGYFCSWISSARSTERSTRKSLCDFTQTASGSLMEQSLLLKSSAFTTLEQMFVTTLNAITNQLQKANPLRSG